MKRLLSILAMLILFAIPIEAQDTALVVNINVGPTYSTEGKVAGASVMVLKKFSGGKLELSLQATLAEDGWSFGAIPGVFIFEGGPVEFAVLQKVAASHETVVGQDKLISYIVGATGLYVTCNIPWTFVGQETRIYGLGERRYVDGDASIKATYNFSVGLSMAIR